MRQLFTTLSALLLVVSTSCYSQTGKGGTSQTKGKKYGMKWKTKPFDHQVFIANKGQFDTLANGAGKVYYGAQLGNVWAYFTAKGIVYSYREFPKKEREAAKDPDAGGPPPKPVFHYLAGNWVGANPSPEIETEGKQSYNYIYTTGKKSSVNTEIYKKITYKNVYPGIDVEYTFPKDKTGFEYSLIIHPGADLSKAKFSYSGHITLDVNGSGEIVFPSVVGEITEHAPSAGYAGEPGSIAASFRVSGNTESFKLDESYDKSKTVIIDPWVTDPLFTSVLYNRAYDLDYDYHGNVYAYGSWNPNQAEKFNSNGAPQWVYNSTVFDATYYGDIVANRKSGTVYLTEGFDYYGAQVIKLNTNGVYLGISPQNDSLSEMWRATYDPCNNDIIIGAGGVNQPDQACVLDTNMGDPKPVNILSETAPYHDIVLIAPDPNGLTCYMATSLSALDGNFDNVVMQLPLPSLAPTAYLTSDGFGFQESNVPTYVGSGSLTANGYDGMAVSPSWLYIYNSVQLNRLNKTTGLLNNSIPISNAVLSLGKPNWGGLAVDPCDDIFLGCHDSIKVFNSSMALDTSIVVKNTVYDVALSQTDLLYACGDSFVCAVTVPPMASLISTTAGSPSSCSACNGTATVNINCGVAPFSFLWSNGSTNQTDTGLCAGYYTVKVTDGSCPPRYDSAVVVVGGKPGYTASVKDTNPGCAHDSGNITVYPTGGTAPYTYAWNTGATTQEITGLPPGTYTCVITDNDGCKYFVVETLILPNPPSLTLSPPYDSICTGSKVTITASGLKTYTWLPNSGLTCYNCSNPIASPTATTTYTVNAVDSNGCTASGTVTVKVLQVPKPVIKGKDSVCVGYRDTLSVTGGTTYSWSTGATTTTVSGIISSTETFTVTAYNGLCSHDTTFTIHVIATPTAVISAAPDTVCQGDSTLLTGHGGVTYLWSSGKTTSTIWVVPSTTTTYTLQAFAGTCSNSTTVTINILPVTTSTISADDTICPGDSATLTTAGSGGNGITYKWSNGNTTTSVTVHPTTTTTYTATVYGRCDSVQKTVTVLVEQLPVPVFKGTNWKCFGQKDTITVSGGCKYEWSSGSTKTTYYTGQINNDSTFVITVKNCFGCAVKDSFTVVVRHEPAVTFTSTTVCAGTCVTLDPKITSNPAATSYKWNTGATTDTTTVCPDSTKTYSLIVSNGCPVTKTTTVSVYKPSIYACCDTTITKGDTAVLTANSSSTYKWYPSTGLNCDTCHSVIATPSVTTSYTVVGTNAEGCTEQMVLMVIVDIPCFDFKVPNVFTPGEPGASGLDGRFYIKTENINGWSIYIYDRWGKEMFKGTDPSFASSWDGTTESGGNAPDGVYYYIISGTCQQNSYKKDGFLQLIR